MEDWVKQKELELKQIEEKARMAMEEDKNLPYFEHLVTAYISGYIQHQVDDALEMLKGIHSDLAKVCDCEECRKVN